MQCGVYLVPDLYSRILLWHKLLAMQTGGLALCSAKHRLNRDEARGWADAARNVADDITAFLETGAFILDDRGQRMIDCAIGSTPEGVKTGTRRRRDVVIQAILRTDSSFGNISEAVGRKPGGLRIAKRKTK